MIGNDLVDLRDRETLAARHPRFDERVFTAAERAEIAAAADPERLRWTLWAAKEAAFKAAKRLDPRVVWSPRRFAVSLERRRVDHASAGFAIDVTVRDDVVHAVARLESLPPSALIAGFVESDDVRESAAVRRLALARLAKQLGGRRARVATRAGERIPSLRISGGGEMPLSLSHHGRFVGFAALTGALPA